MNVGVRVEVEGDVLHIVVPYEPGFVMAALDEAHVAARRALNESSRGAA